MEIRYRFLEECGIHLESQTPEGILNYAKEVVNWLSTHNKNYTNEQYYRILDLDTLLEGIEAK